MERIRKIIGSDRFLLIFSAILSALPYICDKLFLFPFFSYIPYLFVIIRLCNDFAPKKAFGYGFLFSLVYFLISYSFFISMYPIANMGIDEKLQIVIVLLGWIVSSLLHALLYSLIPLAVNISAHFISNKKYYICLLFSLAFILTEKITELTQLAFPWLRISLGLYRAPVLLQFASVFGTIGVDFIILIINSLILLGIISKNKKRILSFALALMILSADLLFGVLRISNAKTSGKKLKAAIIQPSIGVYENETVSEKDEAIKAYFEDTLELSDSDVDIVIWPETAIPTNINNYKEALIELSEKSGKPIYLGIFDRNEDLVSQNCSVLLENGELSDKYIKRHLAPFGEFMPYSKFFSTVFPFLEKLNDFTSDMEKGNKSNIIESDCGKIGSVICFDSVFYDSYRNMALNGSDVIFIITNDAWYKDSSEVYQHLAHSVLRSIECSRNIVRSGNSGISAIIDSRGNIKCETKPLEKTVLIGEYELSNEETVFCKTGDIFPMIALFVFITASAYEIIKGGKKWRIQKI